MSACFINIYSQQGKITGTVSDAESKAPLELATISIFGEDSSLVAYQLSDKTGKFTIDKLPLRKKLFVSVTYTGYLPYSVDKLLESSRADTIHVMMDLNNKDTNAVIVTATIPIRMNGDTLEINPAAFKLKPDAVVEELLNQVSGIVIWSDGSITLNGRKVENLLVDGKPFFGSTDTRIATQNLPKSAIDKIQVYQEYDRSRIGEPTQPEDSLLTMNIKLKEGSKTGFFGKGGGGYGTMDRFESDLSLQVYNKRSSGGIGGGFNNINKNIGSLQEIFQNNTYRNINPNLYNVGRFGASGISKIHSIGALVTHNFIESSNSRQNNRITINYSKSGTDSDVSDVVLQNKTVLNSPQFVQDIGEQQNHQRRHDLGINYVRTNSYNDNLNVRGSLNTSNDHGRSSRSTEVRDSVDNLLSTNTSTTLSNRRSDNESLNMSFAKTNADDPIKSFSVQVNMRRNNASSERKVNSVFESFTDLSKSNSYNRLYATGNQTFALSGSLDYLGFKRMLLGRYNLFGINLRLLNQVNYSNVTDNNLTGDYDSTAGRYITNTSLTYNNGKELFEYTPSLTLSKSFNKFSERGNRNINLQFRMLEEFTTEKNESSIAKRNLDRSFSFFRYEGYINFNLQKRNKYRYTSNLSYSRDFDYPSIDRLYTIVDDINAYDIRIGNPLLKNTINQTTNLSFNYNTENSKSIYTINTAIRGFYNQSIDPVTDSIINDISGKRISYYINADESHNFSLNYNFDIARKVKKNSIQLTYNGQFRTGQYPNYIDEIQNISKTASLFNQVGLQYTISTIVVLNIAKSFQTNENTPSAPGLQSFKNNNRITKLGITVNYPEHFSLSSTFDHIINSNLNKPTQLWNAFATYRFMKNQAEVKFSAMDLLKQYKNITNSVNAYGTSTRITNGLSQYFLLTLSYYPRKFGKQETRQNGRPGGRQGRRL